MNAAKSPASHKRASAFAGTYALLGLLGALIASIVILSCVPPVSRDALVHHLAVPKLYLKHGGMYEIPFMPFSYYPMNVDLLYLIPLYFGNDIVPKFIHFAFALLTAWLLFHYLRHRLNMTYGLFGALFFLSIPLIVKLSMTAYVDLGLIFFSTASLLLILKWVETGFQARFLVLSALCCGLGLGTKYNGLVTFFLLSLFAPFLYSRRARKGKPHFFKAAAQGLIFVSVALLVFSPWMIRNYQWKGNPVYPLYRGVFNPPKAVAEDHKQSEEPKNPDPGLFGYRRIVYGESSFEIALLPLRIFFQGRDGEPQYFDGKLSPFLLFLSIPAFWRTREDSLQVRTEKKVFAAFAVLFLGFALFSTALRMRYIAPILPPLVILSVMGARKVMERCRHREGLPWKSRAVFLVLLVLVTPLAWNGTYVFEQWSYVAPLDYLTGKLNRDQYISEYRPEYPALQFINRHLPDDSLVLFVFQGKRGYFCDKDYIILGHQELAGIIETSRGAEDMASELEARGITHMFICDRLFREWLHNNYSGRKEKMVSHFFKEYAKMFYHKNGFVVLALKSQKDGQAMGAR
jgi:4-amino-4-deoxy-L-arabinose transferase-like glycosyltransferase